jgi:hypothetical protein
MCELPHIKCKTIRFVDQDPPAGMCELPHIKCKTIRFVDQDPGRDVNSLTPRPTKSQTIRFLRFMTLLTSQQAM